MNYLRTDYYVLEYALFFRVRNEDFQTLTQNVKFKVAKTYLQQLSKNEFDVYLMCYVLSGFGLSVTNLAKKVNSPYSRSNSYSAVRPVGGGGWTTLLYYTHFC